jgi:hypothetical protein
MWYGLCYGSWRVLQTRGTPIPLAAAILRTLNLGSSSGILNMRTYRKLSRISAGVDIWAYADWDILPE